MTENNSKKQLSGSSPLYTQLRDILRDKIISGEFKVGTAIPSENELSNTYGINRLTVRNAISILIREGLLKSIKGKGVFVLNSKIERDLYTLRGFTKTMKDKNTPSKTTILNKTTKPAGKLLSKKFNINEDDDIYVIKRLCYANKEPISLEYIHIPKYILPNLDKINLSFFSIYELFEVYNINLVTADETLEIVRLDDKHSKLLSLDTPSWVMLFQCTSYDNTGRIIEFTKTYTRGDKCNYNVHFNK